MPDFTCEIKNLQKSDIKVLVANYLARRQIKLEAAAINLIAENCKINYAAILEAVNKVEDFCHKNKGKILQKDLQKIFA